MDKNREKTKPRKQKRLAFTLLEVMIGIGILGSSLVVLLTCVNQAHKMNVKAVSLLEQSLLAESLMTKVLLKETLNTTTSGNGNFKHSPFYSYSYKVLEVESPFKETTTVSKKSNLLKVTLVVKDKRVKNWTYELSEYALIKRSNQQK